jgi:hypothetical protein
MFDPGFIDVSLEDFWWDEGFLQSQAQLSRFSEAEWKELMVSWKLQSEEWQDRLAYILDDFSSIRNVELLLIMLENGENGVSLRAAEALRGMPFQVVKRALVSQAKAMSVSFHDANTLESINAIIARAANGSKAAP